MIGALLMIAPVIWIIESAFGQDATAYKLPPTWWPVNPSLDNFNRVFEQLRFEVFIFNSLKVTTAITLGQLITCSTAAYAFARLHFPGKDKLFAILISALLIPSQVTIVPLFILMRYLGLYNTHWSLILAPLVSPFGVFLLRQYFLTIPKELDDAVRIDGAGAFTIYWHIILPLSGPALTTLAILTFIYWWNDLFTPLIMINKAELLTLPLGLTILPGRYGAAALGNVAAGITIAIVPVIIVFLILQRYIIRSFATTGLKG